MPCRGFRARGPSTRFVASGARRSTSAAGWESRTPSRRRTRSLSRTNLRRIRPKTLEPADLRRRFGKACRYGTPSVFSFVPSDVPCGCGKTFGREALRPPPGRSPLLAYFCCNGYYLGRARPHPHNLPLPAGNSCKEWSYLHHQSLPNTSPLSGVTAAQ